MTHIQKQLAASFANANLTVGSGETVSSDGVVWVTKWVDYSNKYGLGYMLSNGVVGVFFNDFTKIAMYVGGENFIYVPYNKNDVYNSNAEFHSFSDFPASLQKKVTLLKYFSGYLSQEKEKDGQNNDQNDNNNNNNEPNHRSPTVPLNTTPIYDIIFVKKWLRTKNAIVFRMSNKIVQVNFLDHTKIILSAATHIVTYVNKKRVITSYPLATVMSSPASDLISRLKYTKDILSQIIIKYR